VLPISPKRARYGARGSIMKVSYPEPDSRCKSDMTWMETVLLAMGIDGMEFLGMVLVWLWNRGRLIKVWESNQIANLNVVKLLERVILGT